MVETEIVPSAIFNLLLWIILLYLLKRQVDKLESTDRRKIMNLLVIGSIICYSVSLYSGDIILGFFGGLIFLYGYLLLLYKSFKLGLREVQ